MAAPTALYRLRTPAAQVAQVLLAVNLSLTVADVQLLLGHSESTIRTPYSALSRIKNGSSRILPER